jgi:mono/diheme cytochrome c family protein
VIGALVWLAQAAVVDPSVIARGDQIFAQNCSVGYCHGVAGAASRGPRLRGRGFDRAYLFKVVRDGIPNSAMPAWKDRLSEADIAAVVAYVASLAAAGEVSPKSLAPAAVATQEKLPAAPAQAERGRQLFFNASDDFRCSACHSVGAAGSAIAGDLDQFGAEPVKRIAAAIRAGTPTRIVSARLKDGDTFPALRLDDSGNFVKLYDLSVPPPVLRTIERNDIQSLSGGSSWSHRKLAERYMPQQLADIIAYIRWTASGEKSEVRSSDLQ